MMFTKIGIVIGLPLQILWGVGVMIFYPVYPDNHDLFMMHWLFLGVGILFMTIDLFRD